MLALTVVSMSLTSTGFLDSWDEAARLAEVYGAYVWAYVLLIATLVVILRHHRQPSVPSRSCQPQSTSVHDAQMELEAAA